MNKTKILNCKRCKEVFRFKNPIPKEDFCDPCKKKNAQFIQMIIYRQACKLSVPEIPDYLWWELVKEGERRENSLNRKFIEGFKVKKEKGTDLKKPLIVWKVDYSKGLIVLKNI